MHVVMGDGEMTRKELVATLDDLWQKNEEDGDGNFWFLLQGKSDPTDTDQALVNWLNTNELYYAVITDDKASMHKCYNPAQTFVSKTLSKKVPALLESETEENEMVDILALFASDDPEAEEDRWLNELMSDLAMSGHAIRALNDGLLVLDFESEEAPTEEEPVEEEAPAPSKKAPAKKAAAKPKPEPEEEPEVEAETTEEGVEEEEIEVTRENLETLELAELKQIAGDLGITLPPRTRATTYVNAILGEDDTPEAEVEETPVASTNGSAAHIDINELADQVAAILAERLTAV